MIVCLEGIDASGKETQAKALRDYVKRDRRSPFTTIALIDFPQYQTESGKVIAALLQEGPGNDERRWAETLQGMMVYNRMEHQRMLRRAKGCPKMLVILDRYHISAVVYGGVADGLGTEYMRLMQDALVKPDLNILVNISVDESFRRRPERQDYYESNRAKLETVQRAYVQEFTRAYNDPELDDENETYCIVDGAEQPAIVTRTIVNVVERAVRGIQPASLVVEHL